MLTNKILKLAKAKGRLRSSDLADIGASRTLLAYLAKRGLLRRIARGVYVLADHISEHEAFLEMALRL